MVQRLKIKEIVKTSYTLGSLQWKAPLDKQFDRIPYLI